MDLKQRQLQQQREIGRRRGWMVYLLYCSRPNPVSFNILIELLDSKDIPLAFRQFAEKLEFLREIGYVRVFPLGNDTALSNVEMAKLIQRYCGKEGEGGDNYCITLTTKGVNFQEGHFEEIGITRIHGN